MISNVKTRLSVLVTLFISILLVLPVALANIASAHSTGQGTTYYIKNDLKGGVADLVIKFGGTGDEVFSGDWNGDGIDTLAIRRGNEFIVHNAIAGTDTPIQFTLGNATDEVYVGDWSGQGYDTFALRTAGTNFFNLYRDLKGTSYDRISYGKKTDKVVIGDWDANNISNITVRRGNRYYITNQNRSGYADLEVDYGKAADEVFVGDWDGNGQDSLTIRRGNLFLVRDTLTTGVAQHQFTYGRKGDSVFIGDWNGNGSNSFMVRRNDDIPATLPENNQQSNMKAPVAIQQNTSTAPRQDIETTVAQSEEIGVGYSQNSVNAASYAINPIVTSTENLLGNEIQTAAFYDAQGNLVLARKNLTADTPWERHITQYTGMVTNGHNSISIAIDGDGYLHVSWGMHAQGLQYAKSIEPWSLHLGAIQPMTGLQETHVTYPQFFQQKNGNMFFLFREGVSGNGNAVLNHYDTATQTWTQVQSNLIDGRSEQASAYWQATLDSQDRLQLSWNWRETPDVYSNYNFMYARSTDATGLTWEKTTGEPYAMPITADQAEMILEVPQGSEIMNQTSMTVDDQDNPYVVSYWRPAEGVPIQYMLMYHLNGEWILEETNIRRTDFTLYEPGSKLKVMARPRILVTGGGADAIVHLLVRDVDFHNGAVSLLSERVGSREWSVLQVTEQSVEMWEPIFDVSRWQKSGHLDILVSRTGRSPSENVYVMRVPAEYLRGL